MRALLDDAAAVEHDQAIECGDGRQPVRDGDDRLVLHQRLQILLDRRLDIGIERRGGLVEHQDRRVLEEDTGDRDALALAARQLHAALADKGVVAGTAAVVAQAAG